MSIDLPQNNPPDQTGYIGTFNMFRARTVFAQIQGKVYKQLYSDQAWNRPRDEVLGAVAALDRELEAWRQSIPSDLRPGSSNNDDHDDDDRRPPLPNLPAPYDSNVLILHFCYWYCFSLVHRRYAICISIIGDWPDTVAVPRGVSPTTPGAYVTGSARSMVRLLQHHPPSAKGTRWYLLYYCAAALVNLFGEIINESSGGGAAASSSSTVEAAAEADLSRMRVVLRFMAVVCEEENRDARSMFGMCRKLEHIAADCLEKAAATAAAAAKNGVSPSSSNGEDEEQRGRKEREIVAIQRQLRVHGRFFAPMDV